MEKKKPLFQGSLAAADASRDRTPYSGFLSGLFEGIVRRDLFRSQSLPPVSAATTVLISAHNSILHFFAVESLLWYESQPVVRNQQLADGLMQHFCSHVEEAFHPTLLLSLKQPLREDDSRVFRMAQDILADKAESLESGILAWHPAGHSQNDQPVSIRTEQLAGFHTTH